MDDYPLHSLINLCCILTSKHLNSRLTEFEYKLYERACNVVAARLRVEEVACEHALKALEADHDNGTLG